MIIICMHGYFIIWERKVYVRYFPSVIHDNEPIAAWNLFLLL